jgi:hypothetical protein
MVNELAGPCLTWWNWPGLCDRHESRAVPELVALVPGA